MSLAHETDFDLILMSFQLSDMSSKELATELLAIKPATVMIVVVEPTEVSQYGEEVLSYAVSYVVKPFVISDLVEQISAIFVVVTLLTITVNRFTCMRPIVI